MHIKHYSHKLLAQLENEENQNSYENMVDAEENDDDQESGDIFQSLLQGAEY